MELRHIRYFIAVAEELSFVRAAKRLHISQPPLSQAIRQLETELGIELFDRTRRQIELTDAGQIFLQQARLVLVQVEQATDLAVRAKRGEVGQLRVGFMDPQHNMIVTEFFRLFLAGHPQVHLTSHALAPTEMVTAVQNGKVDLAFLRLASEGGGLVIEPILREPLVVAMSDHHPLCARKVVPLHALANEMCILRARHLDPAFHDFVLATLKRGGVAPKITYEHSGVYTALGMVAAGLAVGLLPASLLQLPIKHLTFRHLKAPHPYVEIEMAYKPDNKSAVLEQFLDVVRQVCKEWRSPKRPFALRRDKSLISSSEPPVRALARSSR
jgi:DNA-binding transcriptional LysR family regulator